MDELQRAPSSPSQAESAPAVQVSARVDHGPAGSLLQSAALPGALAAAAACLLLALSVACLLQRRRRKTEDQPAASDQGAYERLDCSRSPRVSISVAGPSDRTPSPTSRRSLRRGTNEPHFYGGCIAQERPIDFVVPTLAGSSLCGSAASLMSDASSTVAEPFGPPCSSPGDAAPVSLLPVSTSLLGGLNPELYRVTAENGADDGEERSFPESHRGRIWFSLQYEDPRESLELRVIKARNLPSRVCGSVNCCDPFVRIQILPDERRYQQTKFKKKTCNPVFDETYIFQIPAKALSERVLKLTVLDNDRGKRHNVIGHVLFPLRDLDPLSGERIVAWRDLETTVDLAPPDQGELLLGLCYKAGLERLTVTVMEARGLVSPPDMGNQASLDTQVKVTFLLENKVVKSKKTSVVKRSTEPKFMESFAFRLAPAGLSAASVILKLTCLAPPYKDRCLGRVVLGSFMFARGQAQQHWTDAMAAAPKQIHRWHRLS
ncbi:synaptotagmin-15 isoform X2 [Rhipicephalus microplus]|uniref:synaptotagmin-15 isoform X2 n=1 Tax=Rhipicephalus microplus TaxID=6941 RepID=UPI003F6BF1CE